MNLFDIAVAKKLAGGGGGGGGGASNVVTGTFKGTENGTLEVPLSYTGEGYPLSVFIFVKDGIENSPYVDINCQNSMAQWAGSKSVPETAPTYSDGTTKNNMSVVGVRKSSSAGSYSQSSSRGANIYSQDSPAASINLVRLASPTSMKVLIADSGYGFYPNIEFTYVITYSS